MFSVLFFTVYCGASFSLPVNVLSLFLSLLSSTLSSRFVSPQTGSSSRYMGQQNSPVPSPYTPQSPATGYIQPYSQQPPSYNQHQQIQQGESICRLHVHRRQRYLLKYGSVLACLCVCVCFCGWCTFTFKMKYILKVCVSYLKVA